MELNLEAPSENEGLDDCAKLEALPLPTRSPLPAIGDGGGGCLRGDEHLYNEDGQPESSLPLNDSPLIFFSLEDARKLVAERDRLLREFEEVNRKVEALMVLVPHHTRDKILGGRVHASPSILHTQHQSNGIGIVPITVPSPPVLVDTIVDLLDDCLEVMSQDQIEEAVWEIPDFSDKEKYTVETIAKALEKISRRGRASKRGMNYYSKNISDVDVSIYSGPSIVKATEKVLREADESLEAWEVIDKLKSDPEVGDRVKQNIKGVYNALSRLTSRRIADRDADGYRIRAK